MGTGRKSISESRRLKIIKLYQKWGLTQREIAAKLNISQHCVHNALTRFRATGSSSYQIRGKSGRKRKLSAQDRHQIRRMALHNTETRRLSLRQLTADYNSNYQPRISKETFRQALLDAGVFSYPATYKPILSREHRQRRMQLCFERLDWSLDDWERVVFSDESSFQRHPNKGTVRIWRRPEEKLHASCIVPQEIGGRGKVIIWGCFSGASAGVALTTRKTINS